MMICRSIELLLMDCLVKLCEVKVEIALKTVK